MGLGLNTSRSSNLQPGARPEAAKETQNTSDTGAVEFSRPELPPAPAYTTTRTAPHPAQQGSMVGRLKPAVAGTLIAATLVTGCATAGAQVIDEAPVAHGAPAAVERVVEDSAPRPGGVARFNEDMQRLQLLQARGEISADQMAAAREVLYRAHVLGMTERAPKDERGRITVDSVLRGDPSHEAQGATRGQQVMDQLTRDLERRMRITARDMARGDFTPVDGLPGYKELPANQVKKLFTNAFKRIPIGELPFGAQLTAALDGLPGLDDVNVGSMTYDEVRRELRNDAKDYLDARFGDFVDDHKIEVGVVAFAAVTGLRAASPDAAALIDDLGLRVDAWKEKSEDGTYSTRGRLVWRDQHVLPDLDIEGRVNHQIGDHTTLRGHVRGTASFEAEDNFTGTATVGAHYANGDLWFDAAGTYTYPKDSWTASLTGGYSNSDTNFRASGGLSATFGDDVARGDAGGRGTLQLDLGQDLDLGGDKEGYWGLYGGVSADTDLDNRAAEFGLIFRMSF